MDIAGEAARLVTALTGVEVDESLEILKIMADAEVGDSALSVAKSIQEGDTKVELDGKTPEELLEEMADELTKERDLVCFRKIHW